MTTDIASVLRSLPGLWRQEAEVRERTGEGDCAKMLRLVASVTERALAAAVTSAPPTVSSQLPLNVTGLLTERQAAAYLGVSPRHLQDRADIPRLDASGPGAERPMWRYRVQDLEAFAASKVIVPYVPRKRVA